MQTRSYQKTPTQQDLFGIDFAPPKVRAHGLKEAHTYPLVSMGKLHSGAHSASFRVAAAEAWDFPEIEFRTGNSWPCMIQDIDGENALYRIVEAADKFEIKTPCWLTTRKGGGGTHGVWTLERPVHRGEASRKGPLKALARVSEYYAQVLGADSSYCGILSHNPMSKAHGPGFVTNWFHRAAYSLSELGEVIPFGWRRPTVSRTGVGRNCDLFQSLIRWAGCPENRENDCLAAAHVINQSFELPLPHAEVAATARSVHGYRARWKAKSEYYTQEQRTLWGRVRQAKGVSNRRARSRDRNLEIAASSDSNATLAARFEVSVSTIQRIRRGGVSFTTQMVS